MTPPNLLNRPTPHDPELEQIILGAIFLDKSCINTILNMVDESAFFIPKHAFIFRAITELYQKSQPIDLMTVPMQLRKHNLLEEVGGVAYISSLTNRIGSTLKIEHYCLLLKEFAIRRSVIQNCVNTLNQVFDEKQDVFELLTEHDSAFVDISSGIKKDNFKGTVQLFKEFEQEVEILEKGDISKVGISCGLRELGSKFSWYNSELIVIAARPGMGKSAFMKQAIKDCVAAKKAVAIYSLEMNNFENISRLVSETAQVSSNHIKQGRFTPQLYSDIGDTMEQFLDDDRQLLYINDQPDLDILTLKASAKALHHKCGGLGMIVVDYLQLMKGKNGATREQEISSISRSLKILAKNLNIPVVALAQLSRACEVRGGTMKPQLSDLRESGSIEQDANVVLFLWRPHYYHQQGKSGFETVTVLNGEGYEEIISSQDYMEVIIAKNRNGHTGRVKAKFVGEFTKVGDFD